MAPVVAAEIPVDPGNPARLFQVHSLSELHHKLGEIAQNPTLYVLLYSRVNPAGISHVLYMRAEERILMTFDPDDDASWW